MSLQNSVKLSRDDLEAYMAQKSEEEDKHLSGLKRSASTKSFSSTKEKPRMIHVQSPSTPPHIAISSPTSRPKSASAEKPVRKKKLPTCIIPPRVEVSQKQEEVISSNDVSVRITQSGSILFEDMMKIGAAGINMQPNKPNTSVQTTLSAQSNSSVKQNKPVIDFDKLTTLKELGNGNTSKVSLIQAPCGTLYAQKTLRFDKEKSPKLLMSELKSLYECDCPHIISLYDAFFREGRIHIILEYMRYGTLKNILEHCKKLPECVISQVASQILKGLEYIHAEKKIVHRDIKPENILLNEKGSVKLSDFGLAKQQSDQDKICKTFVGSYAYMSLERLKGETHSFDSDIWSFAITLLECFTGKHPFSAHMNFWELIKYLEETKEINIEDEMSEEFKDFLFSCLRKRPGERPTPTTLLQHEFITKFQTPEEKEHQLRRWLHNNYLLPKKRESEQRKKERELQKKKERELRRASRDRDSSIGTGSIKIEVTTQQKPVNDLWF